MMIGFKGLISVQEQRMCLAKIRNTGNVKLVSVSVSETNVMHFLLSLLRIKGLYMFRALLAHPQEALHKRHLVYCVRVMSVGCTRIGV
jgi:hypothetical protein